MNKQIIAIIIGIIVLGLIVWAGYELFKPAPLAGPLPGCIDKCGDGICQNLPCGGVDCPCDETVDNCPEDCEEEDEFANWKTYQNEEYGFEMKYPKYFKEKEHSRDYFYFAATEKGDFLMIGGFAPSALDGYQYEDAPNGILCEYEKETKSWNLGPGSMKGCPVSYFQENNLIGYIGRSADGISQINQAFIPFYDQNRFLLITISRSYFDSDKKLLTDSSTINQILSTFKFLD